MYWRKNDKKGIAPLIIALGVAIAGIVGTYGVYRITQEPSVTYNVTEPSGLFSLGGMGISTEILALAGIAIFALYLFMKRD